MSTKLEPAWATSLRHHPAFRGEKTMTVGQDFRGIEISPFWTALSLAGTTLGAYHGYMRNRSVGWAIAWGLLGGLFPVIVLPVAWAQGFGERK